MSDIKFDESKGIATRMSIMTLSMVVFISIGVIVSAYGRMYYPPESAMYSYPIYVTLVGGALIILCFGGFEVWNMRGTFKRSEEEKKTHIKN